MASNCGPDNPPSGYPPISVAQGAVPTPLSHSPLECCVRFDMCQYRRNHFQVRILSRCNLPWTIRVSTSQESDIYGVTYTACPKTRNK